MIIGMPERFEQKGFDDYTPKDDVARNIVVLAKLYADEIKERKGQGLLFIGDPGSGKTHLAIATMKAINEKYPTTEQMFGNITDVIHRVKRSFNNAGYDGDDRSIIERMSSVRLLCIDDLGKEYSTKWTDSIFYDVVNKRYNDLLRTIFTTNLTPEQLRKRYDPAIVSRMFEMSVLLDFKGIKDYRIYG